MLFEEKYPDTTLSIEGDEKESTLCLSCHFYKNALFSRSVNRSEKVLAMLLALKPMSSRGELLLNAIESSTL